MTEFKRVLPNLYISGRPLKGQTLQMHRLGITAVLNLSIKPDPAWGTEYLQDGQPDDGAPRTLLWWSKGLNFADGRMQRGRLLVHCEAGLVRSPSMAYAILRQLGHDPSTAKRLVIRAQPRSWFRYAQDYESKYHPGEQVAPDSIQEHL